MDKKFLFNDDELEQSQDDLWISDDLKQGQQSTSDSDYNLNELSKQMESELR